MKKQRSELGRAVFYTRDSGGKHDQTPIEYLAWARRETTRLGLQFDGAPESIHSMMGSRTPVIGDLYFDYCVQGHVLSRPALDALKARLKNDLSVSHVFIPRRDRLARPDDPLDGMQLEQQLRVHGITLVFMDRTLPPPKANGRRDVVETLTTMLDYDTSGRFRQDLASKVIYAQLQLATQGFSSGGRAPYGFRRWLVKPEGTPVRELAPGEIIRQAGHHVVWLPGPAAELDLVRRILVMLETMPAARVARQLTAEGIPSPDSGRIRTDNGVVHLVSGVWHQTTIVNIARNSLLRAVVSYGQRSMGDQYRHSATGPRALTEEDLRTDGKPKVVRNTEAAIVRASGKFEPPVDGELVSRVSKVLDERAGKQRGKPRSRQPGQNPLGGRIYDLNCTWPMYRAPYNGSFRYVCGSYLQSHGQVCSHNHVDGVLAARFTLAAIRQYVLQPDRLNQLKQKLLLRATAEKQQHKDGSIVKAKAAELEATRQKLNVVAKNLSFAESQEQFQAISAVFTELQASEGKLQAELEVLERQACLDTSIDQEVEAALARLDSLKLLASDRGNLPALTELFASMNAQLFVRFEPVQKKKRVENKVAGGTLTLGVTTSPIEKYSGPTARRNRPTTKERSNSALAGGTPHQSVDPFKSLRNVSRGDRS